MLGGSASLPLPAPPLPSSSRRYAPQCFVAGIPSPRLATCLTAHPTNRVGACRSVRHSPPRPLPHLPYGAFFFAASALADVPSASLTFAAPLGRFYDIMFTSCGSGAMAQRGEIQCTESQFALQSGRRTKCRKFQWRRHIAEGTHNAFASLCVSPKAIPTASFETRREAFSCP